MLRLNDFELMMPESVDDAHTILAKHPDALVIAGGTDLIAKMKRGQFEPSVVVSLARVAGLDGIQVEKDRVRIGSRSTLHSLEGATGIEELGSLGRAVCCVATPTIRKAATVGGNLLQDTRCRYYDRSLFWRDALGYCMKKSGEDCSVAPGGRRCFASLCSDLAPALIVLDTEVTLVGAAERTIALEALYNEDDGTNHVTLHNEILTEVTVPRKGYTSTYRKLRIRDGFDFPEVGVGVALKRHDDGVEVNVAVTAVSSGVFVMRGRVPVDELGAFADRVYQAIKPMDTLFFPPAYRKKIAKHFLLQSFDELLSS